MSENVVAILRSAEEAELRYLCASNERVPDTFSDTFSRPMGPVPSGREPRGRCSGSRRAGPGGLGGEPRCRGSLISYVQFPSRLSRKNPDLTEEETAELELATDEALGRVEPPPK